MTDDLKQYSSNASEALEKYRQELVAGELMTLSLRTGVSVTDIVKHISTAEKMNSALGLNNRFAEIDATRQLSGPAKQVEAERGLSMQDILTSAVPAAGLASVAKKGLGLASA